jgi:DNA-binding winged helix-turn-helix (wHTH) protein/tetratricopeptide (TPR) repeat protein
MGATLLEFGPFRFDGRTRVLWRAGDVVPVAPKALDLLAALVTRPGDVVTKQELLRHAWPDTVVEEANLSVNVSLLRKALGVQADGRQYIETVARRGYRFTGSLRAVERGPRSLAVLPFRILGSGEADLHLGLAMADALITRLGAAGRIEVRPTSAVQRYAASEADPREAARALRVDAVLEGRMQRDGSRLRVTVQLLSTDVEAPLWAERFDEEFSDLFGVQDAVAGRLAAALALELSDDERRRLSLRPTSSLPAYQACARGRYFWSRLSRSWLEKAVLCFQEAAGLDPAYALPHAGLADAYLAAGLAGALSPRDAWELAAAEAARALELDDRLAEAHASAAWVRLFQSWDWDGAERGLRRAVEQDPHAAVPHQWLGLLLLLRGRQDEATHHLAVAEGRDPPSLVVSAIHGFAAALAGDHARALAQQRRTLELDPHQFLGHWALGIALQNLGRFDEAVTEHRRALELAEDAAMMKVVLARSLALAGQGAEARSLVTEAGGSSYLAALVRLALGEQGPALALLHAACDARDPWAVLLPCDPMLAAIRSEHGFRELAERIGA